MTRSNFRLTSLTSLSPLDGRYREQVSPLIEYFSEFGLFKARLEIEIAWLNFLANMGVIRKLSEKEKAKLNSLQENFSLEEADKIKTYEEKTKHDVKALEFFLRDAFAKSSLSDLTESIHLGLTSEDVNNLSYRLMLKRATSGVMLPVIYELTSEIMKRAKEYKALPMLARTHGQAAVSTTLGKELAVFAVRLNRQARQLADIELSGKVTGAVGSYNALSFAYPERDWAKLSEDFVKGLELTPNIFTTQTNPYEDIISLLQVFQRINGIVLDFDQDMWRYISDGWLVQEVKSQEVGSSTMPQKVNPIRFENSEGNIGVANSLIEYMVRKLPVSRLQRDLSDSTVIRNLGSIFGYSLLSYESSREGLKRVRANAKQISLDLNKDWSILAEAVQTLLRKNGMRDPYALIKSLTRGEHLTQEQWAERIEKLTLDKNIKKQLLQLTPDNYIGLSKELVEKAEKEILKFKSSDKKN